MSKRIKLVVVLAANWRQFDYFAEERAGHARYASRNMSKLSWVIDGTEYRYIGHARYLRGLRIDGFERWGQWYLNPDANKIAREAKLRLAVSGVEGL